MNRSRTHDTTRRARMSMLVKPLSSVTGTGEPRAIPGAGTAPQADPTQASRRGFFRRSGLLAAAAALTPEFFVRKGWALAPPGPPDLTTDTINGLVAFIVPGPDDYSTHQG